MTKYAIFCHKHKYEILLFALIQHLFMGIFLTDMRMYANVIWPLNMLVLGVACIGIFAERGRSKKILRNILLFVVVALPVCLPFLGKYHYYIVVLNIAYVIFYIFIFWEIIGFLIRPSYINGDVILASGCGYLLLIEISVFTMQAFHFINPASFKGIDTSNAASIYMDFVYFCSITFTSIGYGDITPFTHCAKLLTSMVGVGGQFYSVVLVGIIISKFSSKADS